jgi:hypothetical protein
MSAQERQRAYVNRPERAREANERIARQATRLRFVAHVPFLCECSAEDCEEIVLLALEGYAAAREAGGHLTAPGHPVRGWIHDDR